jgi:hypothetical protein
MMGRSGTFQSRSTVAKLFAVAFQLKSIEIRKTGDTIYWVRTE